MTRLTATLWIVAVTAVLAISSAVTAELIPGRFGYLAAALVPCWLAFTLWPWLVLPVGIVGGVVATKLVGESDVTVIVVTHAMLLAAGLMALLVRRIAVSSAEEFRSTRADGPMLVLVAAIAAGAVYGLARGNEPYLVLVAAYQLAVVPAYFFLTTHTLTNRRRIRSAAIAYVTAAAALAAAELTVPGQHGGLLSAIAIPPLLLAVSHAGGWRRAGLVVLGALLVADVVVAAYRSVWLALGVAFLVVLVRAANQARRTIAVGIAAGAVFLIAVLAVSAGVRDRYAILHDRLDDGLGYRLPEMMAGLRVFVTEPFAGGGIGQTTPHIRLPDFATTDVGPVYHVFWVMVLANLGLVGLLAFLWPLWRALRVGMSSVDVHAVAMAGLTCGFIVAASFSGPTDGHWELGLLPALALLLDRTWGEPAAAAAAGRSPVVVGQTHLPDDGRMATAIVVTYNSRAHIVRCLSVLSHPGMLVRVVDNASTDGTASVVAAEFPHVPLETNTTNVGFATAVNQALRSVDTDVVLLVNPDCLLPATTARTLAHVLHDHLHVGVVGPRLVGADGSVAVSAHPFESLTSLLASRFGGALVPRRLRRWLCGGKRRRSYDACQRQPAADPIEVDWLSGACLGMRTDLLRELGGLDERYFMYYEDEDLCMRARQRGMRVLYVPGVQATHVGGASCHDPSWLWPHLYRSMLMFFFQHRRRGYPVARAAVRLRALLGVVLAMARLPWRPAVARARARAWIRVARVVRAAPPEQRKVGNHARASDSGRETHRALGRPVPNTRGADEHHTHRLRGGSLGTGRTRTVRTGPPAPPFPLPPSTSCAG